MSVVIATYNRGSRIAPTLDSVFRQTVLPAEVIVIDDESTDETASWVRSHYPDVKVLSFKNGGTSVARNRGAAAASGDVLVFLDHDDQMEPHAIEVLVAMLRRFPEASAAHADHTLRDVTTGEYFPNHHTVMPAFHRLRRIQTLGGDERVRLFGFPMYRALLHGNLLQQPWAIRRECFVELGGFDPAIRYCEDWDMYLRIAARRVVAVSDEVIAHHLIEGGNLHKLAGQEIQHMKVLRKHLGAARWWQLSIRRVIRKRLALYHKSAGDHQREQGAVASALSEYWRSFLYWPFDAVVAIRCAAWTASNMLSVKTGSK